VIGHRQIKEKCGKQERMEDTEAMNLPNGRTLTMTQIILTDVTNCKKQDVY